MERLRREGSLPGIEPVRALIVEKLHPEKLYLFSRKLDVSGRLESFKLCIVAQVEDWQAAEKEIYLQAECELPFDLLLYSPEEWARCSAEEQSFAHKIAETGCDLLG